MSKPVSFIAFDLGAESGRCVVGMLKDGALELEEVHRFPNGPVRIIDSLHWDVLRIWQEMKDAMRICASKYGSEIQGIGVDTWGVDFALLGRGDVLLCNPYHYRDVRTDGMLEEAFRRVPKEEIFEQTGIQFMQINTLFQLLSMVVSNSPLLDVSETLLMMPDLFNFWLTGVKVSEFSIATTTQFYNPREKGWAKSLLERMGIPTHFLPPIVPSGTILGNMLLSVAEDVGMPQVKVIAPACHDTGSAVAAVPAEGDNWCYISCGTWALMGVEVDEPIINEHSLRLNFTNEGGYGDKIRFLKNIMGLWLVQECRRTWARLGEEYSYSELTEMASEAQPFKAFVDPDHSAFLHPGDMPYRMSKFCLLTSQQPPQTKGEFVRCALESLALKCRWVLDRLEELLGEKIEVVHVVGGGSRNSLLCQFVANATHRLVIAGPAEATAAGSVMIQALTLGYVSSHDEARRVIKRSFEMGHYEPMEHDEWETAYERFKTILEASEATKLD
ncbi:MAG: rhamnulokinase family protein [Armatimonadota bacterium]|nr:rhamnulokinase [Armatimonadota bacterium]MCX7777244.1 rhamnulokinase [Armatimonadota bacterium]MDW8024659.1 rhamnulokinase family protein [Armatimonadota bacterium]